MTARFRPEASRNDRPLKGYDVSAVQTLESALMPADVHSWAITDIDTGAIKGIYARQDQALAAFRRFAPGVFVLTVLHPAACDCPEVAA